MTSIQMAEQDILSHRARWLSPGPTSLLSHLTPSTMEICNMISACIWCDVKITRYNLWHEGEARLDVILAFQTLVRRTRTLADSKRLLYWSDGLSTMLAHLGVGVFKVKSGAFRSSTPAHVDCPDSDDQRRHGRREERHTRIFRNHQSDLYRTGRRTSRIALHAHSAMLRSSCKLPRQNAG